MLWPRRITQWLVSDRLAEMSERVAGRSRLAVWQRVADRLAGLSPIEARGYVRARAIAIVQAETDRLVEQEGPRVGAMREQIIASATGALVETIVTQLQQQRRQSGWQRQAA
jgi:CRP-like cAMP-binding protein